jgi:hypothetical protein
VRAIDDACRAAGISLDVVGGASGNASTKPEALLTQYDLVFAKGRTALEALAVGCATVLADRVGAGPLVTPGNYDALRSRNFGIRALQYAHETEWYAGQIREYSAGQCSAVTARVRSDAALEPAIDRLLEIYAAAMAAPPGTENPSRAAAVHCRRIAASLKEAHYVTARLEAAALDLARARSERDRALDTLEQTSANARMLREQVAALQSEIAAFRSLPTLRIRDAVLTAPLIGRALQSGARRLARLFGHPPSRRTEEFSPRTSDAREPGERSGAMGPPRANQ